MLYSRRYSSSLICSTLNYCTLEIYDLYGIWYTRRFYQSPEGGGGGSYSIVQVYKCHTPSDCLVQIFILFPFSCICGVTTMDSDQLDPGASTPKAEGGRQIFWEVSEKQKMFGTRMHGDISKAWWFTFYTLSGLTWYNSVKPPKIEEIVFRYSYFVGKPSRILNQGPPAHITSLPIFLSNDSQSHCKKFRFLSKIGDSQLSFLPFRILPCLPMLR